MLSPVSSLQLFFHLSSLPQSLLFSLPPFLSSPILSYNLVFPYISLTFSSSPMTCLCFRLFSVLLSPLFSFLFLNDAFTCPSCLLSSPLLVSSFYSSPLLFLLFPPILSLSFTSSPSSCSLFPLPILYVLSSSSFA